MVSPERFEIGEDRALLGLAKFADVSAPGSPWQHIEAQQQIPGLPLPIGKDAEPIKARCTLGSVMIAEEEAISPLKSKSAMMLE